MNYVICFSPCSVGTSLLQRAKVKDIVMDDFSDPEAAAEGTHLALYQYTDMKGKSNSSNKEGETEEETPTVSVSRYMESTHTGVVVHLYY